MGRKDTEIQVIADTLFLLSGDTQVLHDCLTDEVSSTLVPSILHNSLNVKCSLGSATCASISKRGVAVLQ